VETDNDSGPESISETQNWLNWIGNLVNPNARKDDHAADVESDREQENVIEDPECLKQRDVSAALTVPRFNRPPRKSKKQAEKRFLTVNAMETEWNKRINKT